MRLILILFFLHASVFAAFPETTYNVQDFGAAGDGRSDDTRAIQRALNRLNEEREKQKMILGSMGGLPCGIWNGPYGELYFPKGVYRITSTLVGLHGLKITGEHGAVIECSELELPALYLHRAFSVTVENMVFRGGRNHITFWTANQDSAAVVIRNCIFQAAAGYAVRAVSYADTDTSNPADWAKIRPVGPYHIDWKEGMPELTPLTHKRTWANSTRMTIRNCRFNNCGGVYQGHGDAQILADCSVTSKKIQVMSPFDVSGSFFIRNIKAETPVGNAPWISFRNGRIMARNLTFLSKNGKGAPLVVCNKKYPAVNAAYGEYQNIVLEDCVVSAAGHEKTAFAVVEDCPPAQITLRRCREADNVSIKGIRFLKRVYPERTLLKPYPPMECVMGFVFDDNHESIDTALPDELEMFRRIPSQVTIEINSPAVSDFSGRTVFTVNTTEELKRVLADAAKAEKPLVLLAGRKFILNDTLKLPPDIVLLGCGNPVFHLSKQDRPVFKASGRLNIVFSGITVSGGFRSADFCGGGRILLDNCLFYDNRGIQVVSKDIASPLFLQITDSTLFTVCGVVNHGGVVQVNDTWCSPRPLLNQSGFFLNKGTLMLKNMIGIPMILLDNPALPKWKYGKNICWVENSGNLISQDCRYGGEFGGIPVVRNSGEGNVTIEGLYAYFFNPHSSGCLIENRNPAAKIFLRDLSSYPTGRKKSGIIKGVPPAMLKCSNLLLYEDQ